MNDSVFNGGSTKARFVRPTTGSILTLNIEDIKIDGIPLTQHVPALDMESWALLGKQILPSWELVETT